MMGDHSISPFMSGRHGNRDSNLDDSFRRSPTSLSGSQSSLAREFNSSTGGKDIHFEIHNLKMIHSRCSAICCWVVTNG